MQKPLKYELETVEVQFLLDALNRVQLNGVQTAQALVAIVQKLQNPMNSDELQKEEYEKLKSKFEKPSKKS